MKLRFLKLEIISILRKKYDKCSLSKDKTHFIGSTHEMV